jgi:L-amino acid N-acyltransferase YncA
MDLRFSMATNHDWPAIWEVFREVVASGDTYMFSPAINEADARTAWMPDGTPRRVTYVAWLDGVIMGTALLKPNANGLGDHVANAGWMVAPTASGGGVGRRFAQYVLDEARGMGFRAMQFNAVVATNKRAIGLWKSMGFEIVGTVPDAFRHATHGLTAIHIMYRTLL